ncbi:Peptide-N4-(N-acetyl-beta-glucosaminyl)asparagine amidase A [Capsicum chinense]|nr:Peptide-N4-(N-acetyl-beta-glucosaminyl)asparagine amidase A [Capsicum chinense]
MATSSSIFLLYFLLPFFSTATTLYRSHLITHQEPSTPTTFFEVTKPIKLPRTKSCSQLILEHDFGYTYGKPPILANYTPPLNCPKFSKIVLEWTATCKGRQFDRIFGVWVSGVEILRSCTAEPTKNGIFWTVKKDVTRYSSLFIKNQTFVVYLGNIVDSTYTGVYHVKLLVHFYNEVKNFDFGADLIVPISRNVDLNDGLWFEIENSTDVKSKDFKIPRNVYRAVLEVYVSFHENDEFWYANPVNEYVSLNNLSVPGNGAFREVVVSLDEMVVGVVWPFTVIYTGGANPLFWRPISGIGSFDLPSYDIEITPLLGKILDGSSHKISFRVTEALNVWYVDANLHLWLDGESMKTEGKLLEYSCSTLSFSLLTNFTGFDGSFITNASRSITMTGMVKSSYGTITTKSSQSLSYSNYMVMGNKGNLQIVDQIIEFNDTVYAMMPSFSVYSLESFKKYLFNWYSDNIDQGNQSYVSVTNVTLGLEDKRVKSSEYGSSVSSVKNLQNARGYMIVKGHLVAQGLGSTQQVYKYNDDSCCYSRNISSSDYVILHDKVIDSCNQRTWSHWPLKIGKKRSPPG